MHKIIKEGKKLNQNIETYKMCIYRHPYINKQRPWFMTEREKEENRTNISSQSADVLQRAAERNSSPKGAKEHPCQLMKSLWHKLPWLPCGSFTGKKKHQKMLHSPPPHQETNLLHLIDFLDPMHPMSVALPLSCLLKFSCFGQNISPPKKPLPSSIPFLPALLC